LFELTNLRKKESMCKPSHTNYRTEGMPLQLNNLFFALNQGS